MRLKKNGEILFHLVTFKSSMDFTKIGLRQYGHKYDELDGANRSGEINSLIRIVI